MHLPPARLCIMSILNKARYSSFFFTYPLLLTQLLQDIDDMFANLSLDRPPDFVDSVTNNWPVPKNLSPRLEVIKHTHRACPLNVIYHGYPVAPLDVQDVICDCLVEVTFILKHFRFYTQCDQSWFIGTIKQIMPLEGMVA